MEKITTPGSKTTTLINELKTVWIEFQGNLDEERASFMRTMDKASLILAATSISETDSAASFIFSEMQKVCVMKLSLVGIFSMDDSDSESTSQHLTVFDDWLGFFANFRPRFRGKLFYHKVSPQLQTGAFLVILICHGYG